MNDTHLDPTADASAPETGVEGTDLEALRRERDEAQDELLAQDDVLAFGVNDLGGELSPLDGE